MELKIEVEQHFKDVISRHHLHALPFDQTEVLLIGNGYALSISYSREGVEVGYVEPIGEGTFVFHRITNMLGMQRFLADDRKLFGNPAHTVEEQVRASLRVIAAGLLNRCSDILSGDKAWLDALRKKDSTQWKGLPVGAPMSAALSSVLSCNS